MRNIFFVTGNPNKFHEAQAIIPELQHLNIDLSEIQTLDPKELIKSKLEEASRHYPKETLLIVEDISLYLDELNGLPGPLIKWFIKAIGSKGIHALTIGKNKKAKATCVIGVQTQKESLFFESTIRGEIVEPKGNNGFGWDDIFVPLGEKKTFAEMTTQEKEKLSMRADVFRQLKRYLDQKDG